LAPETWWKATLIFLEDIIMKLKLLVFTLIVLAMTSSSLLMASEKDYPKRPITIICPWSAGGGTDAVARIVASELQKKLGKPVNVVNRTGGGGAVGHTAIVNAKPDGYTLGLVTTEMAMMHWMGTTKISYMDLDAVALVNADPAALLVSGESPWQSLDDVLAYIKANQHKVQASGASVGGIWNVSLAGLLQAAGIDPKAVKWIPSKGAAPGLQDLVAGGVDMVTCSLPEAGALIDAGKVKPIVLMSNKRDALYSSVPTLVELGYDWTGMAWRGVAVPKGTPPEIVRVLEKAVKEIVEGQAYQSFMQKRGYGISWANSSDFRTFMAKKDNDSGAVMKAAGIIN
jgi:tripartite-type tricarboxylate transporter receptor subunit TctC